MVLAISTLPFVCFEALFNQICLRWSTPSRGSKETIYELQSTPSLNIDYSNRKWEALPSLQKVKWRVDEWTEMLDCKSIKAAYKAIASPMTGSAHELWC